MTQRKVDVARELQLLRQAAAAIQRPVTFMEVCGTHTMSAFRCGLHSLLPANVTMLSGPGCPVCVTAQGDIDQLIELATDHPVTLCTYGDMLRVPGQRGSLETARSQGADVRVIYSALDAVRLAAQTPDRQVVLGAVGFETTAPNTAAAIHQAQAVRSAELFGTRQSQAYPAGDEGLARQRSACRGWISLPGACVDHHRLGMLSPPG